MQQQSQAQHLRGPRLSTSSHSSTSPITSILPNGLLSSRRASQTIGPNHSPNQSRTLSPNTNQIKRSEKIKHTILIISLTIIFSFLLTITIELATTLVHYKKNDSSLSRNIISNLTLNTNQTKKISEKSSRIRSFFACVWFFNILLFFICLFIHLILYEQHSQRDRARAAFLREFGRIFDGRKSSSNNTLVDYLLKTCLLCFLWYFSCYLLFRSMTILVPGQIIIVYSITVTLRQVLGWIFLQEEFIGNKIIAHILALSGLLSLAHNDGFRFNRFLLGLTMVVGAVSMKTIFDVLINSFIKDFKSSKYRIVMINVCLCGTCLFWPFALLFHVTQIEPIIIKHFYSFIPIITLICALVFNVLIIIIPFKYTSLPSVASLLLVIPSVAIIDHYFLGVNYSPLVISAILCSCAGVLLSLIPKQWFQPGEAAKMKQALGLLNKDTNANAVAGLLGSGGTATGTSSAFEEIRAQRRIRNALLYNEIKT
ncbi:unnamed protein product [Adineta steineri]|uniref:Uncharacterized protein n=1 Tax=Adineta steineri TaxID=433720 RepID=A0A816CYV4_9BILA|nr:unnamed protein product [Adineta steineri]CAF1627914.1 unnamed protein product [Adineta steineri]